MTMYDSSLYWSVFYFDLEPSICPCLYFVDAIRSIDSMSSEI